MSARKQAAPRAGTEFCGQHPAGRQRGSLGVISHVLGFPGELLEHLLASAVDGILAGNHILHADAAVLADFPVGKWPSDANRAVRKKIFRNPLAQVWRPIRPRLANSDRA